MKNISLPENLKVCFFIGTLGHGRGGHFWSLKTTVEALSRRINCLVIDIGRQPSPVIASAAVRSYHVYFTGLNIISTVRRISGIISREEIKLLNVYDSRIFFLARLISIIHRLPLIRTKCGGPSPGKFFPYADYQVIYSMEDKKYFSASKKFSKTQTYLIPNRITRMRCDVARISEFCDRLGPAKITFLRIARFSPHYRNSMIQSINLVRKLNRDGHACRLAIIGTPEDQEMVDEISRHQNEEIRIFTGDEFTLNAGELIDIADFVVGTGRGLMEAASLGKVILTPLREGEYPLLITGETFNRVFATNFSPRNKIDDYDQESNYRLIARAMEDKNYRNELSQQANEYFEEFFNIDNVVGKYESIFKAVVFKRKLHLFDLALSAYISLRCFIPCHFRSFRRK